MIDESDPPINENSFYDVLGEISGDGDAEEYNRLVGLPIGDTLEELLNNLE